MEVTKEATRELLDEVIKLHEAIVSKDGEQGIRDEGGLELVIYSLLTSIDKSPDKIFQNAARYFKLLATRHFFVDGNKRTAYMLVKMYLLDEKVLLRPNYKEAVNFIIGIADGKKPNKEIEKWLIDSSSNLRTSLDKYVEDNEK